ncbi:S-adenosyl-L-methionine-dependent tRNA 4-demethylwyosine synthase [Clydaea vesicula]|uniref:tRNA 4-demethylwyosine synthase (AdoMet-dependent) n=1 Tax=Clydaea vesicula TaxID=447962 RepID=A0AAD5UBI4_9FUNG|nr:S-adenosyl-L-methionine-dependent tRNA 4-demethylwyosine synthase [Clydaea vesicula]
MDAENRFSITEEQETFYYFILIPLTLLVIILVDRYHNKNPVKSLNNPNVLEAQDKVIIVYSTYLNNTFKLANKLSKNILQKSEVVSIANLDLDSVAKNPSKNATFVFLLPTHTDGQPCPDSLIFFNWLEDLKNDHRVGKGTYFKWIKRIIIFGIGDSNYGGDRFCLNSRNVHKWFRYLGAGEETESLILGDTSTNDEDFVDVKLNLLIEYFNEQAITAREEILRVLEHDPFASNEVESQEDDDDEEEEFSDEEEKESENVVDLEDMGKVAKTLNDNKIKVEEEDTDGVVIVRSKGRKSTATEGKVFKEMVTPTIRGNLEKQGYKIVGSHSGVKICRWTKAMLRGRGGCYKHTFYGIDSHRCMESTPSLACANKCVFCWRHGTNPVGTEWKWQTDEPELIYDGITKNHYKMIKTLKGLPGLVAERFEEAKKIKHAALSLVGEPIMYPRINELLNLMHQDEVSTFMVTNAQFPDAIRNLIPVTQLYVSIDAATKDSLKKVDKPLFRDFWERFILSLQAMGERKERTVYRFTLVKEYNTEEIDQYVELVKIGKPDFIEVKGFVYKFIQLCTNLNFSVTFCGVGSKIRMSNVPYYQEVVSFVSKMCEKLGDEYEISCQHGKA